MLWHHSFACLLVFQDWSERSVTWSKRTGQYCHGAPTFGGLILDASSTVHHPDDSREPPDVACARRCEANEGCQFAQAFVDTWTSHLNTRAFPYAAFQRM